MDTAILVDSNNVAVGADGKYYVEKLEKKLEKAKVELMKVLADRNKLIEHCVVELRKLRVNLYSLQFTSLFTLFFFLQLKVVQHELGCKNGLLIARKVEAGERGKIITCLDYNNVAGSSHHDETAKSSQADKETKPSNANKRKQARNQSLGCPPVKAVCAKEEVNKRRSCSRRQSARLKSKGLEVTEDSFPMDNAKIPVSSTHDDQIDASGQTILESSTKFFLLLSGKSGIDEGSCGPQYSLQFTSLFTLFFFLQLKVVQHELGCKNGLLIARKVEAGERGKIITCLDYNNVAGSSHHDETAKSSQADKETKPSNANKRKQARNQSLGCPPVKAVCAKEEVNKRRSCSRRQSARLKSKGLEVTEDSFPMDNAKIPVSSTHDDQIDASGQTILESSTKEEDEENDIPGSEDLGPPTVKAFEVREETEKKRRSRRQSATFKTEESEATEESYEIDAKYHVSSLHDDEIGTSGQTFSELSVKKEYEGNATAGSEGQELRRSSVGRPLRRAAVKVQSYKEIPLKIKMRRME
ncbi:SHUGOSHIN 2 [Morus notabilis]|uniref:SHUGOSHIN 2 n=1 Tax=Morus notabilis TaxID=981085 RepID=UPI000CECE755|nr:SHUGOSHIN 2 [Morus notabilis]